MKKILAAPLLALTALLLTAGTVLAIGSATGPSGGLNADTLVNPGSPATSFAQNKQNEPQVAINPIQTNVLAAGSNDEIDLELCNAGDPKTCPFTEGVGVTGVHFSTNRGDSWIQPIYSGWSARGCTGPAACTPAIGPIGTLPRYFESGLVSDGDPAMVWGPAPAAGGGFSWATQRLYYANLTSNFSTQRDEQSFKGAEAIAVSRLDSNNLARAIAGENEAWLAPVIVSRQNSALFSDKEEIWADNVSTSPYFGNVYICNVAFRGAAGSEPVVFHRSSDGGETWRQRQLSPATNNFQTGGRQGCAVRSDSEGVVYVFWVGTDIKTRGTVHYMARSFDGGQRFERPEIVARAQDVGLFDPAQGRFSFDGVAGARTSTFPTVDIANGAPFGAGATDEIVLAWPDGPTPSNTSPGPNETVPVRYSVNGGDSFADLEINAAEAGDRPNFPAIAISPDGTDLYVTYNAFLQPWQSTTAAPRIQLGVVRHANLDPATGQLAGGFTTLHRGAPGDARASSTNSLVAEFLGDYNYAFATNSYVAAVWNDVRAAADCPAIDVYRQAILNGTATGAFTDPLRPAPNTQCPPTWGNSDIFGGTYDDPS
ncbi:MAG: hypothetical protein H0T39_08325 [Actinobacteria bacterium]|nr:hypothetical protein [Actinomycetota bacterium]